MKYYLSSLIAAESIGPKLNVISSVSDCRECLVKYGVVYVRTYMERKSLQLLLVASEYEFNYSEPSY